MTGRHARRRKHGTGLRLAGYAARTVPWGPLLAGCVTGIGVAALVRVFAGPSESPAALTAGLRLSFLSLLAGLAFVPHDPQRQLVGSLPARAWRVPLLRVALALPLVAAAGTAELVLAARALAVDVGSARPVPVPVSLPWPVLAGELAAWCLLALALAAGLARTRWHDVAGPAALVLAVAVVGLSGLRPFRLLPAADPAMTAAQLRHWTAAWAAWTCAGAAAAAAAWLAAGDPWRRWPGFR